MENYHDRLLADEVLYLHSLWHLGPPNPNPNNESNPSTNSTTTVTAQDSKDWPCYPSPGRHLSSSSDTWPPFAPPVPLPPPSSESAALAAASSVQREAVRSCNRFFSGDIAGSDSESDEEMDVERFFKGIFENDLKLRDYYVNNGEKGDFYCLVCETRKDHRMKGMRYKSGQALVHHASTVYKAGQCGAHRAFARAVCRVFGWDPERLPSIVLASGKLAGAAVIAGDNENTKEKDSTPTRNPNPNPNSNPNRHDACWPCPPLPEAYLNLQPSTWVTLVAAPPPPAPSASSLALGAAGNIQHKAVSSCKRFFSNSEPNLEFELESRSDSDGSDYESETEMECDMDRFFGNIFETDRELREYYVKNSEKGDFYCLVCHAGNKYKGRGMRYKSCYALVQHAGTVSKMGRGGAHRAFARSVCRVLGWDPQRLPSIVLASSGTAVAEPADTQEIMKENGSPDIKKENAKLNESAKEKEEVPIQIAGKEIKVESANSA